MLPVKISYVSKAVFSTFSYCCFLVRKVQIKLEQFFLEYDYSELTEQILKLSEYADQQFDEDNQQNLDDQQDREYPIGTEIFLNMIQQKKVHNQISDEDNFADENTASYEEIVSNDVENKLHDDHR